VQALSLLVKSCLLTNKIKKISLGIISVAWYFLTDGGIVVLHVRVQYKGMIPCSPFDPHMYL